VPVSLEEEARRLLAAASGRDVPARLLGGMAIRLLLGERMDPRFRRTIDDLDFITTRRAGRDLEKLLEDEGWEPERQFNALNGARRLLFVHPGGEHKVDVFVERFEMCHALPLAERLTTLPDTLPAAELALTKLQIVALNEKDRGDVYALLIALRVGEGDRDMINAARIAELAAADWGLYHTLELNLGRLREGLGGGALQASEQALVRERIEALQRAIEAAPKSRSWRLRARIGERRPWYDEPEEVNR
jgi:hypothetical protein